MSLLCCAVWACVSGHSTICCSHRTTAYFFAFNADFCPCVRTYVDTGCCRIHYQKLPRDTTQHNIAERPSYDRNSDQLQEISRDDYRSVDVICLICNICTTAGRFIGITYNIYKQCTNCQEYIIIYAHAHQGYGPTFCAT